MTALAELDSEWQEWLNVPAIKTWQKQQPASWAAIVAYRNGTGPRPNPSTRIGRALTFQTAAWLALKAAPTPPPEPALIELGAAFDGFDLVVSVPGPLTPAAPGVWRGDSFQLNTSP